MRWVILPALGVLLGGCEATQPQRLLVGTWQSNRFPSTYTF